MDRHLSPARIDEVIAAAAPDVVALQELDVGRARSGGVDQARAIARLLDMDVHFHPAMTVMEERYGDAILTRRPARLRRAEALPGLPGRRRLEPRGALWAEVEIAGTPVHVVNTHLGLVPPERRAQVDCLLGPEWLEAAQGPAILLGDMNAGPRSYAYKRLSSALDDAQTARRGRALATFPSRWPLLRIDHIFLRGLRVEGVETPRTAASRVASDHLPLLAELSLENSAGASEPA